MTPYLEITETEMLDIIDKCNDNENAYKECITILYRSFYHLTLFGSTNKLILGSMIYNRIILDKYSTFLILDLVSVLLIVTMYIPMFTLTPKQIYQCG